MRLCRTPQLVAGAAIVLGIMSLGTYYSMTSGPDGDASTGVNLYSAFANLGLVSPEQAPPSSTLLRDVVAAPAAPTSTPDDAYDAFTGCTAALRADPSKQSIWKFREDALAGEKICTLTTTPTSIPEGVAWGPASSYNWNGDFGYWYDDVGVRNDVFVPAASGRVVCCS